MKTETDKFKDAYQRTCEKLSLATKLKILPSKSFGLTANDIGRRMAFESAVQNR